MVISDIGVVAFKFKAVNNNVRTVDDNGIPSVSRSRYLRFMPLAGFKSDITKRVKIFSSINSFKIFYTVFFCLALVINYFESLPRLST